MSCQDSLLELQKQITHGNLIRVDAELEFLN